MTSPPGNNDDGSIGGALSTVTLSGLALTLVSHLLFGERGLVSTGLGALLAVANLWAIGRLVRALFGSRGAGWASLAGIKLLALFLVLYILIQKGIADVMPLAFGYLAMPIGIVLAQLRAAPSAPPSRRNNSSRLGPRPRGYSPGSGEH